MTSETSVIAIAMMRMRHAKSGEIGERGSPAHILVLSLGFAENVMGGDARRAGQRWYDRIGLLFTLRANAQ